MNPGYRDYHDHFNLLIEAALSAADPAEAVKRHMWRKKHTLWIDSSSFNLQHRKVYIISVGKAAVAMSSAAVEVLGDVVTGGVVIAKRDEGNLAKDRNSSEISDNIVIRFGGHPISDIASIEATSMAIDLIKYANQDDLVICLISGGASALLTQPRLSLLQWQKLIDALLTCGCSINELNTVRKQLDKVKGGGLAAIAEPAKCLTLILSDVVGNPLDVIGSGPTVANPDDPTMARQILVRYKVEAFLSPEIWSAVDEALSAAESFKRPSLDNVHNVIIGDIGQAARAAGTMATDLGFNASLLTTHLEGEARVVGRVVAALAKDAPSNSCLIFGGETTVTLRGHGYGGRNQELALAAGIAMDGWNQVVVASFATDGDDGPTDAAGAIVTGETVSIARSRGIDPFIYLDQNDSYHFFGEVGGLIKTGPTGTNVNDLVIILKYGVEEDS
jgi:glycerate 2-kinase